MVTIYVRNKPLYLVNTISGEIDDYIHRRETIFIDELNPSAIKTMLQEMEKDEFYQGVFLHSSLDDLLKGFKEQLVLVQAAGGLVYTPQNEILLIFRRGKWDLPKGKLDEGEDLPSCALREIREETGVSNLKLIKPLQITYHTYVEKGEHILKESHWYLVETTGRAALSPQTEEDIEKCEWVHYSQTARHRGNMHASIVSVLDRAEIEYFRQRKT